MKTISGTLEAIGEKEFDQNFRMHAYMRFLDESGNVQMIKNLIFTDTIDSYMHNGLKGQFHIVKLDRKRNVLFAFSNEKRKLYVSSEIKAIRNSAKTAGWICLLLLPFAVVLIWALVGIIFTPIFIYQIYKSFIMYPNRLNDKMLRSYLNQYGYA